MKIDNFTTARCKKCGWIKQFHPGREYLSEEFICDCKKAEENPLDILKKEADNLGIKYPSNIGESTLAKKIKEAKDGEG
jgi:hypothetical protein